MASTPNSHPTCIPERSDESRTLVLLFDGTGDKDDADVTNVILLRDALLGWPKNTANNPKQQLVFYQQGIGTYKPRVRGREFEIPILGGLSQTFDQAVGWSLSVHVTYGYRWLVENYQPGDKISFFGFSRGAYTARTLAGMLKAVSLLPADKVDKSQEAYRLFSRKLPKARNRDDPVSRKAWLQLLDDWDTFKARNNCIPVCIDFLGCWDTVNSVSIVRPIKLRYTRNNDIVRVFRHALALDEHRVRFKPNFWGQTSKDGPRTDVEEVWFAGCHTDVGGGSVLNNVRPNLAHIPLRWMIREIFKCNTGIIFKSAAINIIGINPSHLHPKVLLPRPSPHSPPDNPIIPRPARLTFVQMVQSFNPFVRKKPVAKSLVAVPRYGGGGGETEEEHELLDCFASAYDQLKLKALLWKPMEYYPMVAEEYQADARYPEPLFKEVRKANKGLGRTVPWREDAEGEGEGEGEKRKGCLKVKVHRSVKIRMQATIMDKKKREGSKYEPRGLVGYGVKKMFREVDPEMIEWVD